MRTVAAVTAYVASIALANIAAATFGPAITPISAFMLIGLDLTLRDWLHDAWAGAWWRMALLIAAGGVVSWVVQPDAGRIAMASTVAFLVAATADAVVYHRLRRRRWMTRANGSNVVGAAIDSILFPTLAFGALLPLIVAGQFLAKVGGGFVWSILLNHRRNDPAHRQVG